MRASRLASLAAALLLSGGAAAGAAPVPAVVPAPGVHPNEVVVGSVLDLSGPLAAEGTAIRNGLTMAFDDINKRGGIEGRKIRLDARDSGYDPARARADARALLRKGIFAMIGSDGTPPVSATMGLVLKAGILHLFPFVPAHTAYVPSQRLEFAVDLPIAAQIQTGLKALLDERGTLSVGVLYREDEFGRAAANGAKSELARRGLTLAKTAGFSAGTRDLYRQLKTLRAAGVGLVVLGAVPQESLRAIEESRRLGWHPVFLCPSTCYVPELPTLGGRLADGLYSVATTPIPYPTSANRRLRAWARRYEARFRAVPSRQALRAYLDGKLFAAALARSGPHPTPLHFSHVLEAMPPWSDPDFRAVPVDYSAQDHLGLHAGYLARIINGRWRLVSDVIAVPGP